MHIGVVKMFPRRKISPKVLLLWLFLAVCCYATWIIIRHANGPDPNTYDYFYDEQMAGDSMGDRQRIIEENCPNQPISDINSARHNFYKDSARELLFCAVPGAASAFMLRVIVLTKRQEININNFPAMASMNSKELGKFGLEKMDRHLRNPADFVVQLEDHFKFLFVRNPYARILSIYLKKFAPELIENDREIIELVKTIKKQNGDQNRISNSKEISLGITFGKFLEYVIQSPLGFWRPISEACAPCAMVYNFVGKLETFHSDFEICLEGFQENSHPTTKIIFQNVLQEIADVDSQLEKYWRTIPLPIIKKFVEAYKYDFSLFGYDTSLESYLNKDNSRDMEDEEKN